MARREEGPLTWLLVLPAAALVLLVIGLRALEAPSDRPADPALSVTTQLSPDVGAVGPSCRRGGDPEQVGVIREAVEPGARVTSTQVVACPQAYDGLRVRYAGELVGDLLHRDGGAWVLVNDDAYALQVGPLPAHRSHRGTNSGLSVWLPDELLGAVTGVGRPGHRGDVVELTGVVVRTDATDGGGLTFRAEQLTVLAPATPVREPFDQAQLAVAVGALGLAGALWLARRRSERS